MNQPSFAITSTIILPNVAMSVSVGMTTTVQLRPQIIQQRYTVI